jgi:peptidoglycan/xylan/chitin deacetylase (PgdA/CDA1 family)
MRLFRQSMLLAILLALFGNPVRTDDQPRATRSPNELGKVMILEYHLIEEKESRWARSVEGFRNDLEQLYREGYRTISLGEYIDAMVAIPAGTRPVILTFDDSSPGQFRYVIRDGENKIDPDCAVGMLLHFGDCHPDFGHKAMFFVLPEAKQPHKLFGQPEFEAQKLRELVRLGFEIGNHTLWHANLGKYDATVVQKQLAQSVEAIQKRIPGYAIRSLALPYGVYPKNLDWAVAGSFKGISYHHEAILKVAGGPAPSPFSSSRDLLHLPRIQVPGSDLQYWLHYFQTHPREAFVSDGKPDVVTFPEELKPKFNAVRFKSLRTEVYEPQLTKLDHR